MFRRAGCFSGLEAFAGAYKSFMEVTLMTIRPYFCQLHFFSFFGQNKPGSKSGYVSVLDLESINFDTKQCKKNPRSEFFSSGSRIPDPDKIL
jgi:hypothetical protein